MSRSHNSLEEFSLFINNHPAINKPRVISVMFEPPDPNYESLQVPIGSQYNFNLDTYTLDIDGTLVQMGQTFKNQVIKDIDENLLGDTIVIHFLENGIALINKNLELIRFSTDILYEIIIPGEQIEEYNSESSDIEFFKLSKDATVYPESEIIVFINGRNVIEIPITKAFLIGFKLNNCGSNFKVKLNTEICVKLDRKTGDFIELVFPANIDEIELEITN